MAHDGNVDDEMAQMRSEGVLQARSIATQNQALAERAELLNLAGAQLAISLAQDPEASEPLLEARLKTLTDQETGSISSDISAVLTEAEQQMLPQAEFVVGAIFKATNMRIPLTYQQQRSQNLRQALIRARN